jgi:hypothetical protein
MIPDSRAGYQTKSIYGHKVVLSVVPVPLEAVDELDEAAVELELA